MPLVRDPGVHHGTCVTHVPWCMSGSQTGGGGETVPGIPGACATRNFTYLARDPLVRFIAVSLRIVTSQVGSLSTVSSTACWAYRVHKKYGNSNSYVNFNTDISIIHHFINTANWKYHFPSPYQISDTFVENFGNYGPWHDRTLNSKKCTFSLWIEIDIFLCNIYTSNIGFCLLIVIDSDVVTDHRTVPNQSTLYLINRFHSSPFKQDVTHSVKML